MNNRNDFTSFFGIIGGLSLIGLGIYTLIGVSTRCVRCNKWYTESFERRDQIKVEEAARDITRSDKHYD